MIVLILPANLRETIETALHKAGSREVGGVLMAEHIGPDQFEIRDLTVHRRGSVFNFVRRIEEAWSHIWTFFGRSGHDYTRFNYIGEWHSHPSFEPVPSGRDDASMMEIVQDPKVGANFAVLLIVKLADTRELLATVHTYLPDGSKHQSTVQYGD